MRYAFGTKFLLPNGREDGISDSLLGWLTSYFLFIFKFLHYQILLNKRKELLMISV